jgi:hypothetical protein
MLKFLREYSKFPCEKKFKTFNMSDKENKAQTQIRGFCYKQMLKM